MNGVIEVGQKVPMDVVWNTRVKCPEMVSAGVENPYKWESVTSSDIFAGKRVIVFALPGAFTPTCSSKQLPEFENNYQMVKRSCVDVVYCLAVNDSFVKIMLFRYQQLNGAKPIPDGSGLFTAEMGMMVDKDNLSFGSRSWRYSMLVNDGVVEKAFVEDGFGDNIGDDPFEVSDALTMFNYVTTDSPVGRQLTLNLEERLNSKEQIGS